MSKTLKLIEHYEKLLEQDMPPEEQAAAQDIGADVQDVTEPAPQEEMPMTSEAENEYISMLVDAALFEPSSEDARALLNLQSAFKMKKFQNAREEALPLILSIINSSTSGGDIRKDLDQLN